MKLSVALALLAPSLASAAIFPTDTTVKMLTGKTWKKTMKANETSMVAFVAPWCGHCQKMAPHYSKAALALHPLIPFYAVDCDANENKRLCQEQGVQGFPTVKSFPRGLSSKSSLFDYGERTGSALFYFAKRSIPKSSKKLIKPKDVEPWIEENKDSHRVLLLTKDKKVPMLWSVLGNKYKDQLAFAHNIDKKGKTSKFLGLGVGSKTESKLYVYPQGSTTPFKYEGILKLDSIGKFFDSILDGTADLTSANEAAKAEEFEPSEEELEILKKQELELLELAHGGYADMADFEKAVKDGTGANYHDVHGYQNMMGDHAQKYAKHKGEKVHQEADEEADEAIEAESPKPSRTAAGDQESGMPATPTPTMEDEELPLEVDPEQVVLKEAQPSVPSSTETHCTDEL